VIRLVPRFAVLAVLLACAGVSPGQEPSAPRPATTTAGEVVAPGGAESPPSAAVEVFVPSEQISPDTSVSFPVDI
jgi:hypothetical protein